MKTLFIRHIAACVGLLLLCSSLAASPSISFTTAKQKAAREGKVLLIDFTASWCMPCRWMDETTFSDPQVLAYLRENYVSIKIDIDDFDGFALKQQFNVQSLPTMIFFASDGTQLDRIEEGVGATQLLAKLSEHNHPANRKKLGGVAPAEDWNQPFAKMSNSYSEEPYTAPAEYVREEQIASSSEVISTVSEADILGETFVVDAQPFIAENRQAERPAVTKVPAIETRAMRQVLAKASSAPITLTTTVGTTSSSFDADVVDFTREVMQADGSPAAPSVKEMSPEEIRIFSLQAGVFSIQDNAVRAADHLRAYTENPVLIEFDMLNDKPVYRIYVGRFTDLNDAETVSKQLYMHGFSCIPKELAMR